MAGVAPFNFSWVVPGVLAGSGLPEKAAHVQYFVNEHVSTLVSLTEWKPNLFHVSGRHRPHSSTPKHVQNPLPYISGNTCSIEHFLYI